MTHALIERLKELHAKSGSRKWEVDPDDRPNMEWNNHIIDDRGYAVCFMAHNPEGNAELEAAAGLIAALHNAFPQIMAELSRLRQSEAELRDVLEMWIHRGNLQTFEDRELFRAAARKALRETKK